MARRRPRPTPPPKPAPELRPVPRSLPGRTLWLLAAAILCAHYALAVLSLRRENPTVDEVNHLPAGISYWQTGTFKLYRHNPPLVKLIAAWPVRGAVMKPLFDLPDWRTDSPPQALFGSEFMRLNAKYYFELFTVPRTLMPLFSVLGGLVVFVWSRRLWGGLGGLLSLILWCACPNILAHARLVTSDAAAASIGVAATFLFWRYLHDPRWSRAALAGIVLGLAQLTKFSLLLLYGIWPVLWLVHEAAGFVKAGFGNRLARSSLQGLVLVGLSVLVIDLGYGFEGVGRPLGSFNFASRSILTRPRLRSDLPPPTTKNYLLHVSWTHRVNRLRGTALARLPSPLPSNYLLGFDEQKIEADALPLIWFNPDVRDPDAVTGYPVYLDDVLRRHGWREYYVKALLYKVPEGTLWLVGLSLAVLAASKRARGRVLDEFTLLFVPLAFLGAMTFLTDINLGLRYVLPMFPYAFIFCGRLAPWAEGCVGAARTAARAAVAVPVGLTILATALIHPSYLAYFNFASGGPDRDPPHLIDSNLDWGQDLIGLREWLRANKVDEPIGLAYFGQIPPTLFALRGDPFPWFVPPFQPRKLRDQAAANTAFLDGPAPKLRAGLYAVSATLVQGLPWRVYDPSLRVWAGSWDIVHDYAFSYFRSLKPITRIGHSILIYRVTDAQAAAINRDNGFH
ncbi:MAG: hypothetical protein JWN86_820 [Planctomycetota bacterium]|nr:hypothetical protein [Planctomycetota bacterium]